MERQKKYTTQSFEETQKIGYEFGAGILATELQKNAVILALSGDLGAGKTTFLQGFAKGLGIRENILSPTFVIMKNFEIPQKTKVLKNRRASLFGYFYHFDLYRLENEKDLAFLNFQEIISNPENIVAIEWPEKLGDALPKNIMSIKFNHLEEKKREISINA